MSRQHRLKKRVRRASAEMVRTSNLEAFIFGFSSVEVEYRRPLRDGLLFPFWRGCPVAWVGENKSRPV